MNLKEIVNTVGVIGAGSMGIGITQVALSSGCKVLLYDRDAGQVEKNTSKLFKQIDRLVEKQKLTSLKAEEMKQDLRMVTSLEEFQSCDLVIEAIVENKEVKQKVFLELEKVVSDTCMLASNTSSISITALSSVLQHPERFIGIHFFNPAPLMPLVEIIPGLLTDTKLAREVESLLGAWNKVPVIAKDLPGFIVNRIARPFYGEALRIAEEGIATVQEIDGVMRSEGFRMGPFELMDLIGIDVNFAVTQTVYKDYFYDPKYRPSLLQQRMSEAGLLGRKTGKGFYIYEEGSEPSKEIEIDNEKREKIFLRIISMLVNEAVEALRVGVATREAIELSMQKGVGYPKGLLQWGEEIGYEVISATLRNLYETYQEDRYRSSPLLKEYAQTK